MKGFFHEVFWEYWVAEYIVDTIKKTDDDETIVRLLGYQRSVVTNRFVRLRIQSREKGQQISDKLRRAFFAAGSTLFAKNQILYLLGRIKPDSATRHFLVSIWNSPNEAPFVRYAAAWAEAMLGNKAIEAAYYASLAAPGEWDEINRGYHLYYYGDINIDEDQVPPKDDGSAAEVTLRTLLRRLRLKRKENLNLRRIELFTVRRFLETGRDVPIDGNEARNAVKAAANSVKGHMFGEAFVDGVKREASIITKLLSERTT